MKLTTFNHAIASALALGMTCSARAVEIERPKVQLIDKLGVNVATGQVTQSMETVRIGGEMGLSHSISVYANELNFLHNFGFADKYWHETRAINLSQSPDYAIPNVYHVSDFQDSATFVVHVNGVHVKAFGNLAPPYTYVPLDDARHSLVADNDQLLWTKPDGTAVRFQRAPNASASAVGRMVEIIYPNGFTISLGPNGLQSVFTNTGFQLKYLYEPDHRPMGKTDNPNLYNAPRAGTSAQTGFSSSNPRHITAINNAIEYCAPSAPTCSLAHSWPTATFDWPAGMPRAMYLGNSQATITNATGAIAKFDFRAYGISGPGTPANWYSPRLIAVTPFGMSSPQYTYDFDTLWQSVHEGDYGSWSYRAQSAGVVKRATNMERSQTYSWQNAYLGGAYFNYATGSGIDRVMMSPQTAAGNKNLVSYLDSEDGRIRFEASPRNFPSAFDKLSGPWETYRYFRGNLSHVYVIVDGVQRLHRQAEYPASCTAATQKTCNKPMWIRDANGYTTHYTHHEPSGNLASVTSPPNKHGISAQTRYEYAQKRARFFNGGASKVEGAPIWLKVAERYCIETPYTESGCEIDDEVVTRFEYHHDNLLMTGMTVTDPNGRVRRTCFQYDRYGNQIGVTQPKANLASCE
jgi:hypothetical protein